MPSSIEPAPSAILSPRDIVRSGLCIGCGACAGRGAAVGPRMAMDRYGQLKPVGDASALKRRSAAFARICPFSPSAADETTIAQARFTAAPETDARIGRFEAAYVGHVADLGFREEGSSGGLVTWVAAELLRRGMVDGVAHVAPSARELFGYRVSRSEAEVRAGAKSRYYPVELSQVIAEMRAVPGRYAVVGVPCFIKAIHLLAREHPVLRERIAFTLGLFCGHMKSTRLVESFAAQMGAPPDAVERVDFRVKNPDRPANWYTARLDLRDGSALQQDWWGLAEGDWGSGFFQNPACNACDDVVAETADIAFGDAWVEPYASDGRGTNVVIVRTPWLRELLETAVAEGRLDLRPVDSAFVVETQAAGFRQRREGLALRLTWRRRGLRPRKRVPPGAAGLPFRRRATYAMRAYISAWSHRVFLVARWLRWPSLYLRWARLAVGVYQGLTYSRGRFGAWMDRVEQRLASLKPFKSHRNRGLPSRR